MISRVALSPEKAYAVSAITAIVTGRDPDGDAISYSYEWLVNGNPVAQGSGDTLPPGKFRKGDQVVAVVTPSDGVLSGKPKKSDAIIILNSPPRIRSIDILPRPALRGDTLQAQVESEDLDGDSVSYVYEWFKNGARLIGQGTSTLASGLFVKGDRITVAATPFDGEAQGAMVTSSPRVIADSPPVISSQPPVGLASGNLYVYDVKATDPDGDAITFSLGPSSPRGMTIDPRSGRIEWHIAPGSGGSHLVEIIAADKDGAKSVQRYQLTISTVQRSAARP